MGGGYKELRVHDHDRQGQTGTIKVETFEIKTFPDPERPYYPETDGGLVEENWL